MHSYSTQIVMRYARIVLVLSSLIILIYVCLKFFSIVHYYESFDFHFINENENVEKKLSHSRLYAKKSYNASFFSGFVGPVSMRNTIGLCLGLTTRTVPLTKDNLRGQLPLFTQLLPSFCRTAETKYSYHFYLGHDHIDDFFQRPNSHEQFRDMFAQVATAECIKRFHVSLHLIECPYGRRPAWAQNDAAMAAYIDNIEYIYRVNDDSVLASGGWTSTFVNILRSFNPPNIGVVGPTHSGGNPNILTYDFTHHSHIDIFGFHYPRVFSDWYADNWITNVYLPTRSAKAANVTLDHTMSAGQRYGTTGKAGEAALKPRLDIDQATLTRFLDRTTRPLVSGPAPVEKEKKLSVIAMSLAGNSPQMIFGALRNAQLAPIIFPGWTIRFYIERPSKGHQYKYGKVSEKLLLKLKLLGAQIEFVDSHLISIPPTLWHYLVGDDGGVGHFIARNCDTRLSDREFEAVSIWVRTNHSFHCMRDHPTHTFKPLVPSTFGGIAKYHNRSKIWNTLLMRYYLNNGYNEDENLFLNNELWKYIRNDIICHDSVSPCDQFPYSFPFLHERANDECVGCRYTAFNDPLETSNKSNFYGCRQFKRFHYPPELLSSSSSSSLLSHNKLSFSSRITLYFLTHQHDDNNNGHDNHHHDAETYIALQSIFQIIRIKLQLIPLEGTLKEMMSMKDAKKFSAELKRRILLGENDENLVSKTLLLMCDSSQTCSWISSQSDIINSSFQIKFCLITNDFYHSLTPGDKSINQFHCSNKIIRNDSEISFESQADNSLKLSRYFGLVCSGGGGGFTFDGATIKSSHYSEPQQQQQKQRLSQSLFSNIHFVPLTETSSLRSFYLFAANNNDEDGYLSSFIHGTVSKDSKSDVKIILISSVDNLKKNLIVDAEKNEMNSGGGISGVIFWPKLFQNGDVVELTASFIKRKIPIFLPSERFVNEYYDQLPSGNNNYLFSVEINSSRKRFLSHFTSIEFYDSVKDLYNRIRFIMLGELSRKIEKETHEYCRRESMKLKNFMKKIFPDILLYI